MGWDGLAGEWNGLAGRWYGLGRQWHGLDSNKRCPMLPLSPALLLPLTQMSQQTTIPQFFSPAGHVPSTPARRSARAPAQQDAFLADPDVIWQRSLLRESFRQAAEASFKFIARREEREKGTGFKLHIIFSRADI